jgi:hypothetical protein
VTLIRYIIPIIVLLLSVPVLAQEKAVIYGTVKDEGNKPIEYANVAVLGYAGGVATDSKGDFELSVPAETELTLVVSFVGYEKQMFKVFLQPGQRRELKVMMQSSAEELPTVEIQDKQIRHTNLQRLDPKIATEIPSLS